MSPQAPTARHRAETQSLATIAKAVSSNAGSMGLQAAVIAAASGMVLTTGFSSTAGATVDREASATSELQAQTAANVQVSASSQAQVTFDRPDVKSSAAPEAPAPAPAPEPVVDTQSNQVEAVTNEAVETQAPQPVQSQQAAEEVAQPQPTANAAGQAQANSQSTTKTQQAPSSSSVSAGIASAAYAQLGVAQDCTMLVTNALAAVGINHHGWPDSYFSLGTQVSASQAQPGDLVYYADGGMGMAHIAVYVGNGQAVHGGWEGGQTVLAPVNVGSGPVYIHVNG